MAKGVCVCGHPAGAHEHVAGFEMTPGTTFTVNADPTLHTRMPDVWVCSGGRLVADPGEDTSPWEFVCGCVLHDDPRLSGVPTSLPAFVAEAAPVAEPEPRAGRPADRGSEKDEYDA